MTVLNNFSKEICAGSVLLWSAHDDLDYPFQTNYSEGWKNAVETVGKIYAYDRNVKITLEAKSKDLHQKQHI